MAKRKTQPDTGSKLRVPKDYRDDQYLPYIFKAESGILETWSMEPDLRDGEVREVLRSLMSPIKKTGQLPSQLIGEPGNQPDSTVKLTKPSQVIMRGLILTHLREAFDQHGPLDAQDTLGILTVMNNSVGSMNRGMLGQEYLKFLKDFMGGVGFNVRQLTEQEAMALGFNRLVPPANEPIEGEYREIE